MDLIKIGRFIAECRKEKGLTQVELSEKIGVSNRAVSKWETGKCFPDVDKVSDLCVLLGISINELFNGAHLTQEDYYKKAEAMILNMEKEKQKRRKKIIKKIAMGVLISGVIIFVFLYFTVFPVYKYSIINAEDSNETYMQLVRHRCPNVENIVVPDLSNIISDCEYTITLRTRRYNAVAHGYFMQGNYSVNDQTVQFQLNGFIDENNTKGMYEIDQVEVYYSIHDYGNDKSVYSEISYNKFTYQLRTRFMTKDEDYNNLMSEEIKEMHDEIIKRIINGN